MTLAEIKASDAVFLLPADIAPVLGCNPNFIRLTAHENPASLGFPVSVIGTRVRVPRKPFLNFIGEGGEDHE